MEVYVVLDTVTMEIVGVYTEKYGAINHIKYELNKTPELREDFDKDLELYGESCITMYGYAIEKWEVFEDIKC